MHVYFVLGGDSFFDVLFNFVVKGTDMVQGEKRRGFLLPFTVGFPFKSIW